MRLALAILAAAIPLALALPASAATPRDGYWSKDGLVEDEFPAIVYFYVRGNGSRIEGLSGYYGSPEPIAGSCGQRLDRERSTPIAPDGTFSFDNGEVRLDGRFTSLTRAEGTFSYTDRCDRVRRGPYPFYVTLTRAETVARYRVELKAWIPHRDVVDPLRPISLSYLDFKALPDEGCTDPPVRHWLNARVSSRYRGDDHVDYPGRARVATWLEFEWDGERIRNLAHGEAYGKTHRDLLYEWDKGLFDRTSRWCNVQTKRQTRSTTGTLRSNRSFELKISSKNPLTPASATPPISSDLVGTFSAGGSLQIAFDTDLFPSHGFTVTRNGRLQLTDVMTDASCLSKGKVTGLTGIETITTGLINKAQEGTVSVSPADRGRQLVAKSKLCELSIDIQQVRGRPSTRGSAARKSTGVARLKRNGRPGRFVSLAAAQRSGLVQVVRTASGLMVLSDPRRPIALRVRGRRLIVEARRLRGGRKKAEAAFGPVSGLLETRLGRRVTARARGKRLRRRQPDRTGPLTRARVRVAGGRARVRFRARDRSGVRYTRVVVGRRPARLRRGVLRVPVHTLRRVRFASVDLLGNTERWRRIRRGRR